MPNHTVDVTKCTGIMTFPYCLKVLLNLCMRPIDWSCSGSDSSCPGTALTGRSLVELLGGDGEKDTADVLSHRGLELRCFQHLWSVGTSKEDGGRICSRASVCLKARTQINLCISHKLCLPICRHKNQQTVKLWVLHSCY